MEKRERWDVYDIQRNKTGIMDRDSGFDENAYACVLHICIFNSKGEMLIQKRQATKKAWPNLWDVSVGGHVEAGETPQMGAERELFEELGIRRDFTGIRPHFTINFPHGFDDYFFLKEDIDLDSLILQEDEVSLVKWAGREEIKEMIENSVFIPFYKSLIDYMFDSSNVYGAHFNEPGDFIK